jgi:hypothetical protein
VKSGLSKARLAALLTADKLLVAMSRACGNAGLAECFGFRELFRTIGRVFRSSSFATVFSLLRLPADLANPYAGAIIFGLFSDLPIFGSLALRNLCPLVRAVIQILEEPSQVKNAFRDYGYDLFNQLINLEQRW